MPMGRMIHSDLDGIAVAFPSSETRASGLFTWRSLPLGSGTLKQGFFLSKWIAGLSSHGAIDV